MTRSMPAVLGLAAALLALLPAAPARAQAFISFLSTAGSDTNDCASVSAPCQSFARALAQNRVGGEVVCLNTGNFGNSFTITQSVTIDCGAALGFSFGNINIDAPGAVVKLRNLTFDGEGSDFGINATNVAALFIENCHILGYTAAPSGIGIKLAPPNGVTAKLHVADSIITANGRPTSGGGIVIQPAGTGSARVVVERTRVENNTYGIFANGMGSTGLIVVSIKDSVVANNAFNGISAFTAAGHSTTSVTVDHSSSLLNGADGVLAQGPNGFVILNDSTVLSNVTGLHSVDGGGIFSYQNNRLTGNVSDGAPTAILTVR